MKINGEDLSSIEKNANEIEYYNSLTKIFKKNLIIIIIVLILLILFGVISLYKTNSEYNLNQNFTNNQEQASEFMLDQNRKSYPIF